jgi:hypothetical protein
MSRWEVLRFAAHRSIAVGCVALLLVAVGCGPLGDDDEDDTPTPLPAAGSPTPGATPRGGPVQVTRTSAAASPAAEPSDDATAESTLATRPARTPQVDATAEPAETPEPTSPPRTPTPPEVEGCEEPEELPDVQGEPDRIISLEADEGVNLRAAPGADCDLLATLQPGTEVVVESGPVQAGEFLWVKVTAADAQGWIAEEFLEPADDGAE